MKRDPMLQPLSRDHYHALVLARRLREHVSATAPAASSEGRRRDAPGDDASLEALATEIRREFDAEIEPHFRIEETLLLPAMERAGEAELVRRTEEDHAALRGTIRGDWTAETPAALGTRLERHVRFEERELFVRAEAVLSEAELREIEDASLARVERDDPA